MLQVGGLPITLFLAMCIVSLKTKSIIRTSRDNKVKWRCTLLINGATHGEEGKMIIEARSVPLGYRSCLAVGAMVRLFGTLRKIMSKGIMARDPNLVLLEVEGLVACHPPQVTRISGPEGIFKV